MFHTWPMSLVLLQAEIHRGEDLWTYEGQDGAGIEDGNGTGSMEWTTGLCVV